MNTTSMKRKLRVAVIGTGDFAEVCHIPGIRSHPQAEVVTVCGRRIEAARALAERTGIPSATADLASLCAAPSIDAVTIATANVAHAEQAMAALRSGKHVFCEKPLAMDAAEARRVTEQARMSSAVHHVAFTFRYNYGLRALRHRIAAGEIGTPFLARIQYDRWHGLAPGWKTSWRDTRAVAGQGMLFHLGSHLFDIIRCVLGPIDAVVGYTHAVQREAPDEFGKDIIRVETDDLVNAWLRMERGLRAQIFLSRVPPRLDNWVFSR